uniref:Glucosamine/galactosamine-6-phosphate isomerase domain-containing protein n=1 Tax=Chlamydomonas chlamydogama TaxID=225041 RepID=A0A7S2QT59_9CHLO|mmetsp:Transcript_1381/g.3027  ORF Transcript_1381/g.3027 Transcript_1381/m.3027 type:complete len:332 (+) Transcript_1381:139-1134(+)
MISKQKLSACRSHRIAQHGAEVLVRSMRTTTRMCPTQQPTHLAPIQLPQQHSRCQHAAALQAVRTVTDYASALVGPDVHIEVHSEEADVAAALVDIVENAAVKAIAAKGSFTLAVPGGSVLKMLTGLATSSAGIDWSKVYMVYVNHKCVPLDDKSSTHKKARDYFLDKVGMPESHVLAVRGTADAMVEARFYEEGLHKLVKQAGMSVAGNGAPMFDLMLIGMGADGHVGSLYPNKPETTMTESWVLPVVKAEGASSITLSHPVMSAGRHIVVCMTGAKKAPAVRAALEEQQAPGSMPAQMIRAPFGSRVVWLMDNGAAADLSAVGGLRKVI